MDKNGNKVPIEASTRVIKKNGKVTGTINILRDITERKQTEDELKRIEWLLKPKTVKERLYEPPYGDLTKLNTNRVLLDLVGKDILIDIMGDYLDLLDTSAAIYEKNGDYALGIFSSGWCQLLDRASHKLCNTDNNKETLQSGKWLCHESCWSEASKVSIETGQNVDIECHGGIHIYAIPIRAGGEIVGSVNFGYGDPPKKSKKLQEIAEKYDIDEDKLREQAQSYETRPPFIIDIAKRRLQTSAKLLGTVIERKQAEKEKDILQAQLVQSEKMAGIGTLTSGIAHEFNNLLQIMSGHSEFAQRTKKPEDIEEALDIVTSTSDKVSKIIKDLLTFSRREPLERKLSSIPELVDFVLSMTEEQLKKNNIPIVREYGRVPKIEVNQGELQQVFLNMVTNARDAMWSKGGKLEIRIKKVKDNVEISFTDTGIGIEEKNLGRVFEPFYTTKGAVGGDTKIQGIGLGLSVSYGIVQRHGGSIEVESKAEKGTTFTVRFPVKVEKSKKRVVKEKRKPEAKKTKSMNVLVVDDEEEICKMLRKWLSAKGHQVKSALTGKKALDLVKKESFDIVFLDIVMPGMTAFDALEKIQEISLKTKVFMITGKLVDKELWEELKAKGASGYLQKPFKIEDIKNCLAKIRD